MSTEPDTLEDNKDPSPYIRTFAKDFAALSGQNPQEASKNHKKGKLKDAPVPAQKTKVRHSAPLFKKPSESLITPDQKSNSLEELSQLEKEAESIDERTREEALAIPTNEKQEFESVSLPRIFPGDVVSTNPASTDAMESTMKDVAPERESILARLKARVEHHEAEEQRKSTPVPVLEPVHSSEMMPRHETPIEAPPIVIPASPLSTQPAAPVPVQAAPQHIDEETSSPLHTYKSDFADRIDEKHASTFSVLAAQDDAPIKRRPRKRNLGKLLAIIAGILLLVAGTAGIVAAYIYVSKNAPVLSIAAPASLIVPDSRVMLSGTGEILLRSLAQQASQTLPTNNVTLTYVNQSTTTPEGVVEEPASGGAFITELNLPAPDILLRNIDPSSMVGIIHAGIETRPFFILRVTSYERTFAGMLQWEPTMFRDLSLIYPSYPPTLTTSQVTTSVPVVTASSSVTSSTNKKTASSTASTQIATTTTTTTQVSSVVPDSNTPAAQFIDEVVMSHSVRALKDNSGRTIVLYGYADKQTLIIARDESAFELLLERLAANGN